MIAAPPFASWSRPVSYATWSSAARRSGASVNSAARAFSVTDRGCLDVSLQRGHPPERRVGQPRVVTVDEPEVLVGGALQRALQAPQADPLALRRRHEGIALGVVLGGLLGEPGCSYSPTTVWTCIGTCASPTSARTLRASQTPSIACLQR